MSAIPTEKSNKELIGNITTNGRSANIPLLILDDADSYCLLSQYGHFNLKSVLIVCLQVHFFPQFWQVGILTHLLSIKNNCTKWIESLISILT